MDVGEFAGAVVVVTGAASGIGRRTAERFASSGATVVGCDLAAAAPPTETTYRRLDVTDEAGWDAVVADTVGKFGKLDVLVNAAGIIAMGNVVDMTLADYRRIMAVNAEGTFLGMKYAMRAMLRRGHGAIINISSTAGIAGSPGASVCCPSKGAVRLMTKAVALEAIAAGSRIRVNSLHPGLTDTPMVDGIVAQLGGGAQTREQLMSLLPAGRLAAKDDIADAILFLASARSTFINGAELVVDNGFTAR